MTLVYSVQFADGQTLFALESVEVARANIDRRRRAGEAHAFPAKIIEYGPDTVSSGRVVETVTR